MLDFCKSLSKLSTCRRLQVAAIIVDHRFTRVLSIGYNGWPVGAPNDACLGVAGSCGCVHAEANALIKLQYRTPHMFMITTHSPCLHCAGLILNAGIDEVFSVHPYRAGTTMNFHLIGDHDEVLKRWALVR